MTRVMTPDQVIAPVEEAPKPPANPCAKRVQKHNAYEVWRVYTELAHVDYYVLMKYQSPEREAKNGFARWYCFANHVSYPQFSEYGDNYCHRIKEDGYKLTHNPYTGLPTPY